MIPTIKKLTKIHLPLWSLSLIPENSGVYIFWGAKAPIYIGKAKNLKNRVSSYFAKNLLQKTSQMVHEAKAISFVKVTSELESLLLEAHLIRDNQPKYNSALKDDKHPLYIVITKEKYPRILASRNPLTIFHLPISSYYGPFPSASNVKWVLRMLRRIFPYSDHKLGKRPCIYSHMGLCNPCPSYINSLADTEHKVLLSKKYLGNIRNIRKFLSGRFKNIRDDLSKNMDVFSKQEKYEDARDLRAQIERLDYITQPIIPEESYLENPNLIDDIRTKETDELSTLLFDHYPRISLVRIECFDIAHLAGTYPTASMVTFINGEPEKSLYRHFRINSLKKGDDISSLQEVAKRRVKRLRDWGTPNLIIVDGGKGQVKIFSQEYSKYGIPVVGLAKREETLVFPNFDLRRLPRGGALNLVQRIRNEAHRFARRYHHKLLAKSLTTQS